MNMVYHWLIVHAANTYAYKLQWNGLRRADATGSAAAVPLDRSVRTKGEVQVGVLKKGTWDTHLLLFLLQIDLKSHGYILYCGIRRYYIGVGMNHVYDDEDILTLVYSPEILPVDSQNVHVM